MGLKSVNPATGECLQTYEELSDDGLERRLQRARTAFQAHRLTSFEARAQKMHRVSQLLLEEKEIWAALMVSEMGKPVTAARAEVDKCAFVCRYYAENAQAFLKDEAFEIEGQKSFVRYLPLGPVLAVMPWNFPFWQVFRFAAPALMAGNVGLLKHASNVSGCALAIESLFERAGFSQGEFQALLLSAARVEGVIVHDAVKAVTLTGSEKAGAQVAMACGKALKKVVLELGGADAFIVMPSADLEAAARTAVTSRLLNNGQSCIAAKRFLIHEAVYGRFEKLFVEGMQRVAMGDPMLPHTQLGPLATEGGRDDVERAVKDAVSKGARLLTGGHRTGDRGFYFEATALTDIPRGSIVDEEEVFGPVAALYSVKSLDEALDVANRHRYGLASSAWTNDAHEQERFIHNLEAGATFVNALVASDPRLPFGGIKKSGFGRELGKEGLREFMNVKTVVLKDT